MKAVIIGAGRVACGFLGQLLSDSGYEVVFVARRPEVIVRLNRGRYLIDVCHDDGSATEDCVDGVRAIALWDERRLVEALTGARLVFTAVGARGLQNVTRPLANALVNTLPAAPPDGVDIISCENMPNAIALVREAVAEIASPGQRRIVQSALRFRRAMVWRIISNRSLTPTGVRVRADDVQRIDIEAPRGWPSLPPIKDVDPRPRMAEAIYEKLHIFNCGHAVAAYLGYLQGYQCVHEALQESSIAETVARAIEEASSWPGGAVAGEDYSQVIRACMRRYQNPALKDRTTRVAARPIQKLGPFERLILPAWAALTFGRTPYALADAIAASLQFDFWQDTEAASLQRRVRETGFERTLEKVSGLRPTDELAQIVLARLSRHSGGRHNGRDHRPLPAELAIR